MAIKCNSGNGVRSSHALVKRVCIDCQQEFEVSLNRHSTVCRCPSCQKVYKAMCDSNRSRENNRNKSNGRGRPNNDKNKTYGVKFDPNEIAHPDLAWSRHTRFAYNEIVSLYQSSSLTPGTVFGNDTHLIVCSSQKLVKRRIGEENEATA